MTITKTADHEATLQQIYALAGAGADIVRCTCNEPAAAEGLARIVPRSPVPIVADIHHQYRRALEALEAGVHCLRLNPGNIRKPEHIKAVAKEAKDRGVPIRIGVNGGSLHPDLYKKYGDRVTPEAMVESALQEIAYFEEVDFDLIKISVKASNVPLMIEAYRQLSEVTDYPLHLGVTEAGPPPAGIVKATAGIATLSGRGDRRHDPLLAHLGSGRRSPVRPPAAGGVRSPGTQERRSDRLPELWAGRDRRVQGGPGGPGRLRRQAAPAAGCRHGLCGERARARPGMPTSASPPATSEVICSSREPTWPSCPRTRWCRRWSSGPNSSTSTASRRP